VGKQVDSYRFLDYFTRKLVRAWIQREPCREIPWTPMEKRLAESTVALVGTAGLALADDRPFDQEGERRNPWWGDPSFRVIPRGTTVDRVRFYHLHVDPAPAKRDLDCAFPIGLLSRLERDGAIGRSADSHYSFMGYILRPDELLERSTPEMIERMRVEQVDVVLLVPY
jgi:D-proline reductase (dithiol) PrdB